jgi:hypothetical protein
MFNSDLLYVINVYMKHASVSYAHVNYAMMRIMLLKYDSFRHVRVYLKVSRLPGARTANGTALCH